MKKIVGCFVLGLFSLQGIVSAATTNTEAFQWAFDIGIITSYKMESFKNEYLTREMIAPLLVNYIDNVARKGYSGNLCKANDIEAAEKIYQDDLKTLCNFGILRGSNNKIYPKRTLNKQEAVALVMRIIDREQEEKTQGHWAYYYYERAKDLGYYGVPNILDDSNIMITLDEFITFLYSTEHPFETISKTTTTINYTTDGGFKSSDDALLKLLEILKYY